MYNKINGTGYLYPTRAFQLPYIAQVRGNFLKKIFGHSEDGSTKGKEITLKEFVLLSTAFSLNLDYCSHILDLAFEHGAVNVLVTFLIVQLALGIPIYGLYVFLSTYSKKSFMTFWECVPLFEGLGYTLGIVRFCIEVFNVMTASLSLILLFEIVQEQKRKDILSCNYGENDGMCLFYAKFNMSNVCIEKSWEYRFKNETIFIPLQYHFRYHVLKYNQFSTPSCSIDVRLSVIIVCMWVLIFFVSVLDLHRINRVTANGKIIVVLMMTCICLYSLLFMSVNKEALTFSELYHPTETTFEFWVDIMHYTAETNLLSNIIWLGSITQRTSFPINSVVIIPPVKLVVTVLMFCYSSRVTHDIVKYYKLRDSTCLANSGTDFLLSFIPETLLKMRFGVMGASLWYIGIVFSSLLTPIYSLIALVNTIIERCHRLGKYRSILYLVFCVIGIVFNLMLATNYNRAIMFLFRYFGLPLVRIVILCLVILALMFLYSTKRIIDDYTFTYGKPPHRYWITFWRTSPTFTLVAFILTISRLKTTTVLVNVNMIVGSYGATAILLSPILITVIIKCCIHVKYRTLGQLSRPSGTWGPFHSIKRQARTYFYPQRDVKYRNVKVKCMHQCNVNSGSYRSEIRKQSYRIKKKIYELQVAGNYEFSDLSYTVVTEAEVE